MERQRIGNNRRGAAVPTAFIGAAARVRVAVSAFALFDVTAGTRGVRCEAWGTDAEARGASLNSGGRRRLSRREAPRVSCGARPDELASLRGLRV